MAIRAHTRTHKRTRAHMRSHAYIHTRNLFYLLCRLGMSRNCITHLRVLRLRASYDTRFKQTQVASSFMLYLQNTMAKADTQHAPDSQRRAKLAVSGCSNGLFANLINGPYEECGWHHEQIVFKKIFGADGPDVFIYFWDGRDDPATTGWWFGPVPGGEMAWAYARSSLQYPPESGWEVNHAGHPKVDPLFVSRVLPPELIRAQGDTPGGQTDPPNYWCRIRRMATYPPPSRHYERPIRYGYVSTVMQEPWLIRESK